MLHELDYDDSEAPAIGLVPPGVTWDDVYDHIKIAHHPLLVTLDDGADHAGAYWDGTKMIVAEDLGPDQDEAVTEFRELLRETRRALTRPDHPHRRPGGLTRAGVPC